MARRLTFRNRSACRDRAAVATTAIFQIIETAPTGELRRTIEALLRTEFSDVVREVINDDREGLA
jgi:hypothetical protein